MLSFLILRLDWLTTSHVFRPPKSLLCSPRAVLPFGPGPQKEGGCDLQQTGFGELCSKAQATDTLVAKRCRCQQGGRRDRSYFGK